MTITRPDLLHLSCNDLKSLQQVTLDPLNLIPKKLHHCRSIKKLAKESFDQKAKRCFNALSSSTEISIQEKYFGLVDSKRM